MAMKNSVESEEKVAYDARLIYYDVLKKVLEASKIAGMNGNYLMKYRGLREIYSMVKAYINVAEKEKIDDKLARVRSQINSLGVIKQGFKGRFINQIELDLQDIEDDLHMAAKTIFLPVGSGSTDEVDWDAIRKRGQI